MVSLCQRDKIGLLAFGGNRKEPSDKVRKFSLRCIYLFALKIQNSIIVFIISFQNNI